MEKIKTANKFLLNNLFWIVPLNFALILFGIFYGIYQRQVLEQNQIQMKHKDSLRGIKIDSVNSTLKNVISLENTLNKIK